MRQDTLIPGSLAVDGVPSSFDPEAWFQGMKMPDPGPLNLDLSLASGDYRGHIIDGLVTLYHEDLRATLDSLGVDNIDYFPVTLRDQKNGELDTEYLLANVLGLVDCVDMQKSKVEHWESGMGFDFLSMVIDPAKARGFKLFRLKDDPTKVIIDEELKQHFEATDMLVGVTLIQTEDYRDR